MEIDVTVQKYNEAQSNGNREICDSLAREIQSSLSKSTSKVWHGAPVWFIEGNPVVGYWVRKDYVQLLFWSGQSFDEPLLSPEGKFKAAEKRYTEASDIDIDVLRVWLEKALSIQWDYKNIVKRRGELVRLK